MIQATPLDLGRRSMPCPPAGRRLSRHSLPARSIGCCGRTLSWRWSDQLSWKLGTVLGLDHREFIFKNDELCIQNDEFVFKMMLLGRLGWGGTGRSRRRSSSTSSRARTRNPRRCSGATGGSVKLFLILQKKSEGSSAIFHSKMKILLLKSGWFLYSARARRTAIRHNAIRHNTIRQATW